MVENLPTNFPEELDSFANPSANDSLASPSHSQQHANLNDAVEALQQKVGVDNSTDPNSIDYKLANLDLDGSSAFYQADPPESPEIGDLWIESDSEVDTYSDSLFERESFVASSGQTVFNTQKSFVIDYEQVYLNGVLLKKGDDYTTPNTSSVVLTSPAATNDILEIIFIISLSVAQVNYQLIKNNGVALTGRSSINFVGAVVVDDPSNDETEIQIVQAPQLPNQSGNSGRYLTTNGTSASWSVIDNGSTDLHPFFI